MMNERRVKEPKRRPGSADQSEKPAAETAPQTKAATAPGALRQNAQALEDEVGRGRPGPAPRRQGDDGFVDQSRNQEHAEGGAGPVPAAGEGAENEAPRERMEGGVPAGAPEFSQRRGQERGAHDRLGVDPGTLPGESQKMEQAEVQ